MLNIIQKISENKRWPLFFIALLLFFSAIRIVNIEYDPPEDMSLSAALYTDEGFKAYSSRNWHLFGDWKWTSGDNYRSWHRDSPVPTRIFNCWYTLFGNSLSNLRYLSVLVSTLSMILLFFFVKRFYDISTAFTALILFGLNHFNAMYGRLVYFEVFIEFFLLVALFSFAEMRIRILEVTENGAFLIIKKKSDIYISIMLFLTGMLALILGFYTKKNINIVILSVLPITFMIWLYTHQKLSAFVTRTFYLKVISIFVLYFIFAHFSIVEDALQSFLNSEVGSLSVRELIPLKGSKNFDDSVNTFFKSLYLEFIFLNPFLFFSSVFYALYSLYSFLHDRKLRISELILATWLIFGLIFLTILKYHPSRYYILLIVPMVILGARFITSGNTMPLSERRVYVKDFLFRITSVVFVFYFIYYMALALFIQLIPYSVRKKLMFIVYRGVINREFTTTIPVLAGILLFFLGVAALLARFLPRLKSYLSEKRFYSLLFVIILLFHSYQNLKWFILSDKKLYNSSVKLAEILPPQSIITGCWSAGLVMYNRLRALVIQGELNYNLDVAEKIIVKQHLLTCRRDGERSVRTFESDMPLYLAVSTNGDFDKWVREYYSSYLTHERKIMSVEMGLYDVEVYRLTD
jgi:4-amino-4-deoxy-L-arabinose transferase-like glycosyltransferase